MILLLVVLGMLDGLHRRSLLHALSAYTSFWPRLAARRTPYRKVLVMEAQSILNPEALTLFLYFVVPGFVALHFYDVIVPSERRSFGDAVIQLVSYSLFTNLLTFWAYQWVLGGINTGDFIDHYGWAYTLIYVPMTIAVVFVLPALLAIFAYKSRSERGMLQNVLGWFGIKHLPVNQMPTVWDAFFSQKPTLSLIFHMKDGETIVGAFGNRSFASAYPAEQVVYVEEIFMINEQTGFLEQTPSRSGAIIRFEDCDYIETIPQHPTNRQ